MKKIKYLVGTLTMMSLLNSGCKVETKINTVNYSPFTMSHNDYEQEHPLMDALAQGMRCVEADLFLVDGELYVSHTEAEIDKNNTFDALYLKPLQEILSKNNGRIYHEQQPFYLYINLKTGGETEKYINKALAKYKEMFAYVDADGYHPAPIKAIGGNWKRINSFTTRFLFGEGKLADIETAPSRHDIFLINDQWEKLFTWKGEGEMPAKEELKLRTLVNKAHAHGRIIRFWNDKEPAEKDVISFWTKLRDCGVDLISTDNLAQLSLFAATFDNQHTQGNLNNQHAQNNQKSNLQSTAQEGKATFSVDNGKVNLLFNNQVRLQNGLQDLKADGNNAIEAFSPKENMLFLTGKVDKMKESYSLTFEDIPNLKQGMASRLFADWESWTKPYPFKNMEEFPTEKVEFSIWQYSDGLYAVAMPLCDENAVSMLGKVEGRMGARVYHYMKECPAQVPLMAIAFGNDPYRLIDNLYFEAMRYMGRENNLRENKSYPKAFEGLTWCTWNAMYEDVSADKITKGLKSFHDHGITIPTLLIDDGWLDISDDQRLRSFEFDKKKFPHGGKEVFDNLRKAYHVQDFGLWHTMNGYWAGIDPESKLYKEQKGNILAFKDKKTVHDKEFNDTPYYAPSPLDQRAYNFYDAWYTYLQAQGVTFVKVDQQAIIKRIARGNCEPSLSYSKVAKNMEASLQRAIRKHFNGQVINCQDMATEALFNMGSSAVIRNSEDFFPAKTEYYGKEETEGKGNAAVHALMNLHNAVWTPELAWPDYDMFQSYHVSADYHAALRAISGGPIFLTDVPGKQNFELLKALSLTNGKILRLQTPGRLTEDCLFNLNSMRPIKAAARHQQAGFMGIWNVDDADKVKGTWSVDEIKGLTGDEFIAYNFADKQIQKVQRGVQNPIELGRLKYAYWNIVPVEQGCAVIGLTGKYNAAAAVIASVSRKNSLDINMKEGGELAVLLPSAPKAIMQDGKALAQTQWKVRENGVVVVDLNTTDQPTTVHIDF